MIIFIVFALIINLTKICYQYVYFEIYAIYLVVLKILLFTLSSWICGLNNDIGSAVIIAKDRTNIKSVVKWLMPSAECASAKVRSDILFLKILNNFTLTYNKYLFM